MTHNKTITKQSGFTLIELSIVLVIIGLIVGGVLVGQDLIRAAEVRATVSQIEKYNTSVNTFRVKYNATPGDMSTADSVQFVIGFTGRAGTIGKGNGDGVLQIDATHTTGQAGGENGMFWGDLGSAGLMDGSFSAMQTTGADAPINVAATSTFSNYMPPAKLGRNNFIFAYSISGTNYYGMAAPAAITATTGAWTPTAALSVIQAYNIDKKVDDGLPSTGSVKAETISGVLTVGATNAANPVIATTCYDSTALTYAIGFNGGAGVNCALDFRFQ